MAKAILFMLNVHVPYTGIGTRFRKNAKRENETPLRTSAVHATYLSSKITENFFPFVEE